MYSIPELSEKLASIAEAKLPKFSGPNTVLEVIIQFNYGVQNTDFGLDVVTQHIKVLFWRPGAAMLVAYNSETHVEDIPEHYYITANHSSTWKHDGLNFFHEILLEPKKWEILEEKIVEVGNACADKEFTYTVTQPV